MMKSGSFMKMLMTAPLRMPQDWRFMPYTNKNIGRNYLRKKSKYKPHQGKQEAARRVRQMERAAARQGVA